jgi:hypothetical protein
VPPVLDALDTKVYASPLVRAVTVHEPDGPVMVSPVVGETSQTLSLVPPARVGPSRASAATRLSGMVVPLAFSVLARVLRGGRFRER